LFFGLKRRRCTNDGEILCGGVDCKFYLKMLRNFRILMPREAYPLRNAYEIFSIYGYFHDQFIFSSQRHASAVYAVVVCLSVTSQHCTQFMVNTGSRKQRLAIDQGLHFLMPKISAKFRRGHSQRGRLIRGGVGLSRRFLTNI